MNIEKILERCDHTLLSTTATWDEIKAVIDDGIKYKTASVCIPPCYVKRACEYADGRVKICTVIGFPNGYSTTASKAFEAGEAVKNGADEIDTVINRGLVKAGEYGEILDELKLLKKVCGDRVLKVIIETAELSDDEKIKMCKTVSESDADYIKTSTGFSSAGATPHDIELFKNHITSGVKIKAAGGISSLEDAELFINLGADRLGTSRIVKIAKSEKSSNDY